MKQSVAILVLAVLLMQGCSIHKNQQQPAEGWENITVPFKLSTGNISPSGKAYFERNKNLYISMRYFGMEILSLYADNDSIFLYDKIHSILVGEKLGNNPFTGKPLDVNQLQDFLLGIDNYAQPLTFTQSSFVITIAPDGSIETDGISMTRQWDIYVAETQNEKKMSAALTWDYENAVYNSENIPSWRFPGKIKKRVNIDEMFKILSEQL